MKCSLTFCCAYDISRNGVFMFKSKKNKLSVIKRYLLIFAGLCSLALGVVGIFLPILPTTPFLLLASFLFLKSSERLYQWVIHHKVFGKYIENYIQHRAITIKAKVSSIVFLWTTIILSAVFFVKIFWVRIILLVVAIGVTWHLLSLKTLPKESTD